MHYPVSSPSSSKLAIPHGVVPGHGPDGIPADERVDHRGAVVMQGVDERRGELPGGRHPRTTDPECTRHGGVIDVDEVVDLLHHLVVQLLLDVHLEGERAVVQDDHDDRQAQPARRLQLADVVTEPAVSGDTDDGPVRRRQLRAQRGGEGPAQRTVRAQEPAPGPAGRVPKDWMAQLRSRSD